MRRGVTLDFQFTLFNENIFVRKCTLTAEGNFTFRRKISRREAVFHIHIVNISLQRHQLFHHFRAVVFHEVHIHAQRLSQLIGSHSAEEQVSFRAQGGS